MKVSVLTLKWDRDEGNAVINFSGMDKLHGIEKMDFIDDCIDMLMNYREEAVPKCFEDYTKGA